MHTSNHASQITMRRKFLVQDLIQGTAAATIAGSGCQRHGTTGACGLQYFTKCSHKLVAFFSHVVGCEAVASGNYPERDGSVKGTMVGNNRPHRGILSEMDIGVRVLKQVSHFIHRFLVNQAMLPRGARSTCTSCMASFHHPNPRLRRNLVHKEIP